MSRKPRVQRTPEEKWQIVLEGLKSGNVAETCRKYEIAPNLYYRHTPFQIPLFTLRRSPPLGQAVTFSKEPPQIDIVRDFFRVICSKLSSL